MMQRGLQIMVLNILTCSLWTAVCQVIWLSGWFFCCFCCFFIIIINIYMYAGCFLLHKTERGEICVDCANMSENVGRQRICLGRLWQEKKESWKMQRLIGQNNLGIDALSVWKKSCYMIVNFVYGGSWVLPSPYFWVFIRLHQRNIYLPYWHEISCSSGVSWQ